ncbi:SPFH domain-containing protein [Hydrogenoanaerobacterium saccharovorans]|uniref:SPFH domain-containing protein n=1 Tax=Hydrogenoanaerobacterium saccharovorans TaxID=474960 RepID=A0ABS2GQW5_9FIRM|nr:SPFH domain-containing protein [Hydrogenoanaerobacterium saccharovorans]MBM6924228.1 SPFH domain-containing protein [Hydrogenoanaerobacterium saccharovorans]
MLLFDRSKKTGGFMDEIRCDEPSYLIWKWRPTGAQLGKGNRENAIRWGSSLRVKDGEVAVFVYSRCNETVQEYIEGPCDMILNTKNLPILASLVGLAYEGGTPFQAEVYFINLARIIQVKFGVPFFDIYDPRFTDFGVPVAVRGTVSFSIEDYRAFIKLHRLNNFQLEDFQQQIRDAVSRYVKDTVANAPATHNIPVIQIETKTAQINDMVEYDLAERLKENFGILVSGIDIGAIEIDKNSEGYHQLMAVTKNIATVRIEAETQDYMERLRIHREEEQYAAHKQTQTVNIGAFQVEKQADVGIAGAQALGQMGANGTGNVNWGGSADGFNMAAMMASMTIGSAVGRNIADAMNPMTGSMGQSTPAGVTPPPILPVAYYVAVNSKAIGPFELSVLAQMASSGQLTADSLVWKNGMSQWEKAKAVDELKGLFSVMPPIPEE